MTHCFSKDFFFFFSTDVPLRQKQLLFSFNPNSSLTYNTSSFSSSLDCLSNWANMAKWIYQNPLQPLQMLHWQTFTRQSHFQSVLSLKPWAARSLSETMFRSDKVHRGGKRSAKWHSRARCRFQEKPHISPPQNNSSLSRLESSLLTTEPCKSGTPSLTAMAVGCSLDYVALLSFVPFMSCFAGRDDGINLLLRLRLPNWILKSTQVCMLVFLVCSKSQ